VKGIADTGFLVAFVNRADEHHDWEEFTAVISAKRFP
jgi:predicted nucleic acid-binding protein